MLMLSRKWREKVLIRVGDKEITIVVSSFNRQQCRLGFEADKDVIILRQEIADKNKKEDAA